MSWGISLIVMGVISIVFTTVLSQIWGFVLIILGILALTVRKPGMLIAIGCSILLAGLLNTLLPSPIFWKGIGVLQFYWAIRVFLDYGKCGNL
jgi:hypothetical protein